MIPIGHFLILSAMLFAVGAAGVIISRNLLIMLMSIELMLNAANLAIIAFSRMNNIVDGHVFVFIVFAVAAAEAAVGLAIIIMIFRNRESINADNFSLLKR
ncbi:MAG: NADH-quinone oxidoreductase subunit NuoK [Candidatus Zixiibacteriota bacterium]|nr:MAG: NADH-quinone oxidoreductase subunit NuoK [candidate division Zixibacteria bacterium]HDL04035.1 NADH-quinone oxidoreductase subunit NuoK [candidate division Zixibacteria bacterium]